MKRPTTPESMAGQRKGKHTKTSNILALFCTGISLNRFEAEHSGEHCLNSTVSTLANAYGLQFERTPETVPNRFGSMTRVIRYRLADCSVERAQKLLKQRRGIQP